MAKMNSRALESSIIKRRLNLSPECIALLLVALGILLPASASAQVSYVARFTMEKERYLLGEPVFCVFTIQNTGSTPFGFLYRSPSRALNRELEGEPRFSLTNETGHKLPDPAPVPCGGAKGSVVYGSVTLPPGQAHSERWLLQQWGRFSQRGKYQVHAERRLPLLTIDPATREFSKKPVAYALAINEIRFQVDPAPEAKLDAVFQPYLKALNDPKIKDPAEAVLVVTTLPRPSFLAQLESMASDPSQGQRWDRKVALEGLARLGTPAAWEVIVKIAHGPKVPQRTGTAASHDDSLQAYAIALLAEKGDKAFLPLLLDLAASSPEGLRGDVLRALGFFQEPRASQLLFEKLHAPGAADRMNAILGLRNSGSRDVIPALLAMLNDPETEVRQVAHYALENLTGQRIALSSSASREEFARVADQWHAWWRDHGAEFVPSPPPPCHDW